MQYIKYNNMRSKAIVTGINKTMTAGVHTTLTNVMKILSVHATSKQKARTKKKNVHILPVFIVA